MSGNLAIALGRALREARLRAKMTLNDVQSRSGGKFKPSAVGGYERGERTISVERLTGLGEIYGVPTDRLVAEALAELTPEARRKLSIDTSRLARLQTEVAKVVAQMVHRIKDQRGDYLTDVITLRSGDIEELAFVTRIRPRTLLMNLQPALIVESSQSPHPQ